MQENWFNQKSNNLEILIVQHLKRVVSRPELLLFAREKVMSMRLAYVNDIFKKVSECVYKNCTPASLAMKTAESIREP
jgi:hypothetical protein